MCRWRWWLLGIQPLQLLGHRTKPIHAILGIWYLANYILINILAIFGCSSLNKYCITSFFRSFCCVFLLLFVWVWGFLGCTLHYSLRFGFCFDFAALSYRCLSVGSEFAPQLVHDFYVELCGCMCWSMLRIDIAIPEITDNYWSLDDWHQHLLCYRNGQSLAGMLIGINFKSSKLTLQLLWESYLSLAVWQQSFYSSLQLCLR